MHIINYNSTGESSFKIFISTNSSYIIFNNTNYNNITFNLDTPLKIGDERHEFLISLSNLQIPISWPLISSYIGNNYFEYILNGITYNYTIPDGSYSATDLKTLFNSNISLVVSYNKNNGKFIFTHTTYEFTITNNTTCYYEIGFLNNNYTSSALTLSSILSFNSVSNASFATFKCISSFFSSFVNKFWCFLNSCISPIFSISSFFK